MTGVITWTFDCGDGVCIEREQPSTARKPMTHFTTFDSFSSPDVYHPEFQPEPNGFESPHGTYFAGHDPLTGLDTGSGNDRLIGIETGSGDDHIVHHIGGSAGPGGTSYFSGYSEAVGLDGYMVCPEPPFLMNLGTTSGPGGTTYFTENLGSTSGPGGTSYFTNFAMPVGDFI